MWEGYTTAHRTRVRHMRHARLEAGRVRQNVVSKRRAHSVGSAAASLGRRDHDESYTPDTMPGRLYYIC